MSTALPLVAFAGVLLATFRSLGWGFVAIFAVGYFHGVIRANYLGVATTFLFDVAVLALYIGFCIGLGKSRRAAGVRLGPAGLFVLFLMAWPAFLSMLPVNHYLVQLVALRATIWYLPVLLIATRLTAADLAVVSRGLVVLNLMALAAGVYVYRNGVEALYPLNAVTLTIHISKDVAGGHYRVPSTFLNSHSYGGTMLFTLPFLLERVAGVGVRLVERGFATAGVIAAAGGLLMCGARSPLVILAVSLAIGWFLCGFSLRLGLVAAVFVGAAGLVASNNERFQRASSLADTEALGHRIAQSTDSSFMELLRDYPAGAGMGSGGGTSIPYFLAHVAPKQVGLENEYSRILVDQGWVGLGGWLAFVGWLSIRPPPAWPPAPWRLGVVFMYSLTLATWMTAFIGTGTLSGIPVTVFLMTQMGVVVAVRDRGVVPEAVNPRPRSESPRPEAPAGFLRGPGGCWLPAKTTRSAG